VSPKPIRMHRLNDKHFATLAMVKERTFRVGVEHIPTIHDNLGSAFDTATALVGLRHATGGSEEDVVEAVGWVRDVGVALFRRAVLDPSESVTMVIAGRTLDVPGGGNYRNSAPRWADALGAALILRDADAVAQLCAFPPGGFLGEYARYHDTYARTVMAFHAGEPWRELLDEQIAQAEHPDLYRERGRRYGLPLARVVGTVLERDQAAFTAHLADGLGQYRVLYGKGQDRSDPRGVLPLRYIGWCARAHDDGLTVEVSSDYLPSGLVTG